ncbi:MAG: hypothetical protein ACJAXT_001367, partial [Paracoccaceae bacterium]
TLWKRSHLPGLMTIQTRFFEAKHDTPSRAALCPNPCPYPAFWVC